MWNGKNKAVTFSFDDGVRQDIKAVEILNQYGLKATFNLNSGYVGTVGESEGTRRDRVKASEVRGVYAGHEIAVHTLTHPNLTELDEETIVRQIEEDRKALEDMCGYAVCGMAYPCGGKNNDERVARIIRENTPIKYARTITSTHNFHLQTELLRFNPSVYYINTEKLFELGRYFICSKSEEPQIFYIWGHTYEMDMKAITWETFEVFCRLIADKKDIFYGTNREVLLKEYNIDKK